MSTVQVRIQAISTGFSQAQLAFKGLRSSFSKLRSAVFNLKTAFAAAGIGIVLKKVASESIRFEDALLDLQKVMSDTDGDAKRFTGTVNAMSSRFGIASAEILQGAANFKQAGFTIKESFELQKIALETATVSQLSVAESSALLVRALKGFKVPASEAGRLIDIMNEVSNRFATSLRQLGVGMADVSPVAEKMGFSFEETAGILTTMIEVFQSGSEAATAFNFGLIRLISSNKQVTDALHDLGVKQKEIVNGQEQMRKGSDIFFDVQKAFLNIAESEKLVFTQRLAGIRQTAKLSEIYDGLAKTTEITNVGLTSFGSRLKEVNIRLSAASTKLAAAREAFNNMARVIGDVLMPSILKAAASLKTFFEKMQEREAIEKFKLGLNEIKEVLKILIQDVATLGKFIFQLPPGLHAAAAAALLLGTSLGRAALVFVGLEAAIKTFPVLWNLFIEAGARGILFLQESFNKLFDQINRIPGINIEKIDTSGQEALVDFYTNITIESERALEANKTLVQSLIDSGKDINAALRNTKGATFDASPASQISTDAPFVVPLPEEVKKHTDKVVEIWQKAFKELGELSDAEIRNQTQKIKQYIKTIEESGQATGSNLGNIWHNVRSQFEQNIDLLDEKTLAWFKKMDERYPQLSDTAEKSLVHIQNISLAVTQNMTKGFEGFFMGAMKGFKDFEDFAVSMLNSIQRSIASIFAGMATSSVQRGLAQAFPSMGTIFGIKPHEGGEVGSLPMRQLTFAPRFHRGGLARDEVPAILQTGEGVLSRRGMNALDQLNQGRSGGIQASKPEEMQVTIVNLIDPGSLVSIGLQDPRAKGIVINHISADTIGRGTTFKTLRGNL